MIIGTAGHIDHGKSALVRALTGVQTDRLAAEKERGISIELGYAYLPIPDHDEILGFIDVPGHEALIHTMVAGATGMRLDRKSTRLNSSHVAISYAVFCLKKKKHKHYKRIKFESSN